MDRRLLRNLDWGFLSLVFILAGLGLLVLASASASASSDPLFYIRRQLIWWSLGLVGLIFVLTFNYLNLIRMRWFLYGLNLLMLLAVLVIGKTTNGAQSWINLGSFVFQPSEFSKLLMIISFAGFLASREDKQGRLRDLVPSFLFFAPPMLLIMAQPDLGTSLVFLGILFGMLFLGGARPTLLLGILFAGGALITALLLAHFRLGLPIPLKEYQLMRLVVFLNPYQDGKGGMGAGYQLIQSQVAIGSGGLWGKGWLEGSQAQLNFLPYQFTDFIFSVVGEEWGFAGGIFLLFLYFLFLGRAISLAGQARDRFGTLLIAGVVSQMLFHVLVNVGMTIGMMPITGIPLPFISYGGSNMLANMLGVGLILNINMRRQKILF